MKKFTPFQHTVLWLCVWGWAISGCLYGYSGHPYMFCMCIALSLAYFFVVTSPDEDT
jgi:hypothetical protein